MKDFDLEIKVSKYFEFYYSGSDLPQELVDSVINHAIVISKQNKFSNIRDLDDHVNSIIEKFETKFIEQTRRDVIIYSINFDSRDGDKKSLRFNFEKAVAIAEKRVGFEASTRYFKERLHIGSYDGIKTPLLDELDSVHGWKEMDWTAERELWFTAMANSIEALGERLKQGIGKSPEVLGRKIDQAGLGYLMIENQPSQTPLTGPQKKK